MTPEQLLAIKERVAAIQRCERNESLPEDKCTFDGGPYCGEHHYWTDDLCEDIAALLAEVARLSGKVEQLEEEVDRLDCHLQWLSEFDG